MSKPVISIRNLLSSEERKVSELVAEIEAQDETHASLWTERLLPSAKGGKSLKS